MTAAMATLRENCVGGIAANEARLAQQLRPFVGVITALTPHIGYGPAAKLAERALATNESIADLVVADGLLTREQVAALLVPERLVGKR